MGERSWMSRLTEEERILIQKAGYGKSVALGSRPALLLIDFQYNYVGEDVPVLEQLDRYPSAGGSTAWNAARATLPVLELAREKGLPIIFTRNLQRYLQFDSFSKKTQRDQSQYCAGNPGTEIIPLLQPFPNEHVLDKAYASAFYATPLESWLIGLGVDSLIVVGGTTCGCVRATVVDAVSRNYRVSVVEECLFDRISVSHDATLLDMWMKYCSVSTRDEIIKQLQDM